MAQLEACPVCRQALDEQALAQRPPLCPGCGTDLAPYVELAGRTRHYIALALELLARGDTRTARQVVDGVRRLDAEPGPQFAELTARLALAEGDPQSAQALLPSLPADVRIDIERELGTARLHAERARELYNYALSLARQGAVGPAADKLSLAVQLAPREARIWALKAKVDIRAGRWDSAYRDLSWLDELGARPAQLAGAERLLPPLAAKG
jgi:uncharacterized protein HemY